MNTECSVGRFNRSREKQRRYDLPLEIREVKDRKSLKQFIDLPKRIHLDHPNWVPPIYSEDWKYFDPKRNKEFQHSETVLALAVRDNEVAGRIMGIINHRYNNFRQEKNGRFAYLECPNEKEVAHSLLDFIEQWSRERGMNKIIGPMGFSDQDPEGYMIEGFEYEPTLSTYINFDYMIDLLEEAGYRKEVDYVVYKLDITGEIPQFYRRIHQRVCRNQNFTLVEFTKRNQIKPHILAMFGLMNATFKDNYGYFPLDANQMKALGKKYLPVVDPRFVKLIRKDREIVAFVIGIPNMAPGIRKAKGRLLPFGIFKILHAMKTTKQLDLYLGGIKDTYRGRGLDVMLGVPMIESAQRSGFTFMDSHHELETNLKMRAEMERLGGKIYKRYRIFQKQLDRTYP
jgi:hypothetical protein